MRLTLTYRIRPEYWEKWGSTVDEKTRVTMDNIKMLAREWEVSVEKLMEQVEAV